MARPERYFIGPGVRDKLRDVFARVDGTPQGTGGGGVPTRLQDMGRPAGDAIRLGKTVSAWNKGTLANVELYDAGEPPSETKQSPANVILNCVNKFTNVAENKWVIVARASNGWWYLISAECG